MVVLDPNDHNGYSIWDTSIVGHLDPPGNKCIRTYLGDSQESEAPDMDPK